MHNVLILNYHALATAYQPDATAAERAVTVKPEDFEAQMALIKKLRMPVVSLDEVAENFYKRKRWHRHVLAITCSDSFLTNNDTVLPLLEHYGFPATVFITTQNQHHAECWAQWRQIAAAGFSLGSDTVSHACLTALPETQMREQLVASKEIIESETGQPVRFLSPPFGAYNRNVIKAVREAGYEALLTNRVGVNRFNTDLFQLKRWTVPAKTSLKEFERMLTRDKKELVAQKVKARALRARKNLVQKGPLARIKNLLAKVRKKAPF